MFVWIGNIVKTCRRYIDRYKGAKTKNILTVKFIKSKIVRHHFLTVSVLI